MHLLPIIKKEFLQLIRDRYTIILILFAPVLYMLIFSLTTTIDINRIKVAAFAPNASEETRSFIERINHNPLFEYKGMIANLEEGRNMMIRDRLNAILVFPSAFGSGESGIQILTDATNPFIGSTAGSYLSSALTEYEDSSVGVSVKMLHNPGLLSVFFFGPGFMCYAMLYFVIILVAASFAKEKETGTIYSIVASPAHKWEMLSGKSIPYVIIGFVIFLCCFAAGHWGLEIPLKGRFIDLSVLVLLFIITTILLGAAISTFSDSQTNAIVLVSSIITLPVAYFCGIYSPVENMPQWAQEVSKAFYISWFMDAFRKIMIEGQSLFAVWKDILCIGVSTVIFAFLDHHRMKNNVWLG